jgi:hypothetical protein
MKHSNGVPTFADSQRDHILKLLREAKARSQGVRKSDLIYVHHYSQAGARIFEIEAQGAVILRQKEAGEKYVTYFLVREPDPAPDSSANTKERRPIQGTFPLCDALERQM